MTIRIPATAIMSFFISLPPLIPLFLDFTRNEIIAHSKPLGRPAEDINDAIAIAKANPEFAFGTTARVEVRPIKMKEETTSFVYPTTGKE